MSQIEEQNKNSTLWRAGADWVRMNAAPAVTAIAVAGLAYTVLAFFFPALPLNPVAKIMDHYRYQVTDDPWACPDQDYQARSGSPVDTSVFYPPTEKAGKVAAKVYAALQALGLENVHVIGHSIKLDYPDVVEVRYFNKSNHLLACYLIKELAKTTGLAVRLTPVDIFDPNNLTIEVWLPNPSS